MPQFMHEPEEINLLEYIYFIIKQKWWIISVTILGYLIGYGAAIAKGPTYVSEAIIASKATEGQGLENASKFGFIGGFIANQLNLGGDASLDKIKVILESRQFNTSMIKAYDLLPFMYKSEWPKEYKNWYDSVHAQWRKGFEFPNFMEMGDILRSLYLKTEIINKTMSIKISTKDTQFTDTLMSSYLLFLNRYIQNSIQLEAKEKIQFIENQTTLIRDPLLREKVEETIAQETEKLILASNSSYHLIDSPMLCYVFKEKRKFPMIASLGFFFFSLIFYSTFFTLKYNIKSEVNRSILQKIKYKMFHL
jgi:hypothetical protein